MRKDNAKHADVEHLLGNPTIHLDAVGRNAHHRRHRRCQCAPIDELAAIEHELECLTQPGKIERRVLHFIGDAVELRARHGDGAFDVDGRESDESGLVLFKGFDYAVKAGYVWHVRSSLVGDL